MRKITTSQVKKYSRTASAIALVVVVFLLTFITIKEVFNKSKLDNEIIALDQEIAQLKVKKQGFMTLIDRYEDEFYLEQQARAQMNLKKPGEKVVVVKLDDRTNVSAVSTPQEQALKEIQSGSNTSQWWNYFFATEKILTNQEADKL